MVKNNTGFHYAPNVNTEVKEKDEGFAVFLNNKTSVLNLNRACVGWGREENSTWNKRFGRMQKRRQPLKVATVCLAFFFPPMECLLNPKMEEKEKKKATLHLDSSLALMRCL